MADTTEPTATTTGVDEAPISPIRERTNTLEHALSRRPETKDLLDRGILHAPPGVAATVQQKQHGMHLLPTSSFYFLVQLWNLKLSFFSFLSFKGLYKA